MKKDAHLDEDANEILAKALETNELNVAETFVTSKMMSSFILRDTAEAEKVARQYLDFFEDRNQGVINFINIYRYFFGGLIAFECFRRTHDQYWEEIGRRSISKFEIWTNECEWNFENKLLLLQAEQQFSHGKTREASLTYELAVLSAREHRFIHEEALSCELTGIFYQASGMRERSLLCYQEAVHCYTSWGAIKKAEDIMRSMSQGGHHNVVA